MENRKKEIYNRSSGQAKQGDSCPLMHVKQVVPLLSLSMKRKLTLLFLVTMFAGLNVRAAFNLPKDDEGYYLISTPEDLVAFSDYVNNTVNANSSWGRLTADIDMSGVPNFWPIGMFADTGGTQVRFYGHFDGAGHVIKNLTVAREDNYEVGLFSRCENAVVENLGVVNAKMTSTSEMNRNGVIGVRVGVICGELNKSTMRNCWTAGTIELSTLHPQKGYLSGEAANNSQFINCYSTGDVLVNGSAFSLTNCWAGDDVAAMGPTGELCFTLNGDQSEIKWYQTLGEDEVPCQDPTHKQVFGNGPKNCDGSSAGDLTYSNTDDGNPVPPHEYDVEGYCQNCGHEGYEVKPSIDQWYEITTPQELRWVSRFVNKGSNTISIRLMNDLDMSDIPNFPPMGKHRDSAYGADDLNFRGTFDGQYHVISNLYIEVYDNYEAGFFGRTQSATVKNVGFVDPTVINYSEGPVRAGVVGGELYQSTFTNVWTAGDISVTTDHAQCAGFGGEAASSTLNNCWSTYEGLFVGENKTTLNNCRYFAMNENIVEDAESGALCWALNNQSFDPDKISYYQTLGDDHYPTWDKTHGLVYLSGEGDYACATDEESFQQLVATLIAAEHAIYEEVIAPASLIDTYLDRLDALENKSFPDFLAAYKGLQGLRDAITNAQASYAKYQEALVEVQAYVDENSNSFAGEERDLLVNYLSKEVEPGDTYPNGSSLYILKNRNLNSNYVNSEIGYVQQLLNNAIQHGYAPGADITNLLTNANFADGTAGWNAQGSIATHNTSANVTKHLLQGQNGTFEVSQTLTDLKDGLYEFRIGGYSEISNGLILGAYNYRNLVFANDNANYQKPLFSDLLTAEEVEGYAGFEEKFDDSAESIGWKPNSTTGVCNAIDLGHWDNRVIAEVTDGVLTVGVKGVPAYKLTNSDFLGNARLRYLGEMESEQATGALTALLEDVKSIVNHITDDYIPNLYDYKEAPNYYVGLANELRAFAAEADNASTGAEKYALLSRVRDIFERINESKLIYSELREMSDELQDVYGINAPEQLDKLDEQVVIPVIDMFESGEGTNEQALELIERMRNDDIYKIIRGHEPELVDGFYQLGTPYNLIWFTNQSNNGNTALNAVLTNDIDMSEIANFTPICRHRDDIDWDGDGEADGQGIGTTYGGTFDGQGHVIKNLTVIVDDGCEAGLFSRTSGAVLKNIGFENATIKNIRTYNNDTQGVRAGVLAGEAHKSSVLNCYSIGNIVVETLHDQCNGLCGEASASSVQGCYTTYAGTAVSGGSQVNVFSGSDVARMAATGELTYRLNFGQDGIAFYQTLGEDAYPVLDSTHKQIYGHGTIACNGAGTENSTFDNEPGNEAICLDHALVDGICENCGFDAGVITEVVNGYYLIANPYNLRWFSKYVNQNNGGANARLVADIDMKDINDFRPISRYSDDGAGADGVNVTYSGTFDGDFHVIRNLHMEFNQRLEGGLFGRMTSGGVVKNLGMENVSIKNTHSNGCRIGCVVGENNGGTVQNVYTIGNIEIETFHAQKCGIAGEAANGSIVDCYTTWNVLQTRGTESNCYAGEDVAAMAPTGELCYKMNKGVVNNPIWRQTIGTDPYPTFNKDSKVVFALGDGYTNEIPELATAKGTEDDPFVIKTAEDLVEIRKYMNQGVMNYMVLENDIDMSSVENWTPLNTDAENYLFYINFDGKGHVIRNFAPKNTGVNYQSFFGILCGGVKDVGFEDADVTCTPTGSAIVAAWAGRTASYSGSTFFEHVYVTGKLTVGSGYAGGMVGSVNGITDIHNCYANVDITGASSVTGGIVGRVSDALTMENVYAAGTMNRGGGIVGGGMSSTTPPATYKNVVVWNNDFENFGETSLKDQFSGLSFYNGSNFAKLQETVVGWDNTVWSCDMAEGSYPVLLPMADAITPMFVDRQLNSNAVYTLTGVKVAKDGTNLKSLPKGIYVIGNKKVLVK